MTEVVETRAELIEALHHACHHAKRQFPVVGTYLRPTAWDRSHDFLNSILTDLEAAK